MDAIIIRLMIGTAGILLIVLSFLMHSYKKITVNYTVIWVMLGFTLLVISVVPVFSEWTKQLASGTGLAFSCVGAIFLFEEFRNSVMISQLMVKTREMAMHVALLNQENEAMMKEIDRLSQMTGDDDEEKEEDSVCC